MSSFFRVSSMYFLWNRECCTTQAASAQILPQTIAYIGCPQMVHPYVYNNVCQTQYARFPGTQGYQSMVLQAQVVSEFPSTLHTASRFQAYR